MRNRPTAVTSTQAVPRNHSVASMSVGTLDSPVPSVSPTGPDLQPHSCFCLHDFDDQARTPLASTALILIVLLYVALRLWHLASFGLWTDEIISFQTATQSWSGLMSRTISEVVHPPLFFVLLKVWIAI